MILANFIPELPDWITLPALGFGLVAGGAIVTVAFRGFN